MTDQNPELLPHILVVDDDARIRGLVSKYLNQNGFITITAADAAQAREALEYLEFDALVVDIMMPGETGLSLTHSLREKSDIPVLLLTALGEADDRIAGFESGADDYLPKPFEPRELILRLKAILRRRPKAQDKPLQIRLGRWTYDGGAEELHDPETEENLRLTTADAALIKALGSRPNEVISRDELAGLCGVDAGERTIDVQVTRLRKKIEEDSKNPRLLVTVRGKGYMLRLER